AFVAEVSRSYPTEYPEASRWSVRLESIEESWTRSVRPMLVVLLAAVGFVLLIVAVNLASLLVARSSARTREIAIRQALGASRPRLVRQVLSDGLRHRPAIAGVRYPHGAQSRASRHPAAGVPAGRGP